jgi:hypothetical protein
MSQSQKALPAVTESKVGRRQDKWLRLEILLGNRISQTSVFITFHQTQPPTCNRSTQELLGLSKRTIVSIIAATF